jgi:hypothetical protein
LGQSAREYVEDGANMFAAPAEGMAGMHRFIGFLIDRARRENIDVSLRKQTTEAISNRQENTTLLRA